MLKRSTQILCLVIALSGSGCSLLIKKGDFQLSANNIPIPSNESIVLAPENPSTNDTLSVVSFEMYPDERVDYEITWDCISGGDCPLTTVEDSVAPALTAKDQIWQVSIRPRFNGKASTKAPANAVTTIINSAPNLQSVSLSEYGVTSNTLSLSAETGTASDPDEGDDFFYRFCWYLDDGATQTLIDESSDPLESQSTLDIAALIGGGTSIDVDDELRVEVYLENDAVDLADCNARTPQVSVVALVEATDTWRRRSATIASGVLGAFDEANERFITFFPDSSDNLDVAELSTVSQRSTMLRPRGSANFPTVGTPAAFYDANNERMIVIGPGPDEFGPFYRKVNLAAISIGERGEESWITLDNVDPPFTHPVSNTSIFDPATQRIFVWLAGPSDPEDLDSALEDQLWSYALDGGTWTRHPLVAATPEDAPELPPFPRVGFDPGRRVMLLFVGLFTDPAIFEIAIDPEMGLNPDERRISLVQGATPPSFFPAGIVYEPSTESILLYYETFSEFLLYRYDLEASTLTQINAAASTPFPLLGRTGSDGKLLTISVTPERYDVATFDVSMLDQPIPELILEQNALLVPRLTKTLFKGALSDAMPASPKESEHHARAMVYSDASDFLYGFDLGSAEWFEPGVLPHIIEDTPDPSVSLVSANLSELTLFDTSATPALWTLGRNVEAPLLEETHQWNFASVATMPNFPIESWAMACDEVVGIDRNVTWYLNGATWTSTVNPFTFRDTSELAFSGGDVLIVVEADTLYEWNCISHTWQSRPIAGVTKPTPGMHQSLTPYRDGYLLLETAATGRNGTLWRLSDSDTWEELSIAGSFPSTVDTLLTEDVHLALWEDADERFIVVSEKGVWELHLPPAP